MTPAKLNLFFAFYPYGGNGGISSEYPAIRTWFQRTMRAAEKTGRVAKVDFADFSDTPITMTRNESIEAARASGADVLIMCDSDIWPDYELLLGEPGAKPFFESSFDLLYQRRVQNQLTVIGAPYCGPPPIENVYVFRAANFQSEHPSADFTVAAYTREEAAERAGFEPVFALPTGLIMFDLRAFDLLDYPYFYYEYEDDGLPCQHCGQPKPGPRSRKASTEDVTCTRDLAFHCLAEHGYNPLFVNWDAWAAHMKPKAVGKPRPVTVDMVGEKFKAAVQRNRRADEKVIYFRAADQLNADRFRDQPVVLANGETTKKQPAPTRAGQPPVI